MSLDDIDRALLAAYKRIPHMTVTNTAHLRRADIEGRAMQIGTIDHLNRRYDVLWDNSIVEPSTDMRRFFEENKMGRIDGKVLFVNDGINPVDGKFPLVAYLHFEPSQERVGFLRTVAATLEERIEGGVKVMAAYLPQRGQPWIYEHASPQEY